MSIPYTDQEVHVMLSKKQSVSHVLHLILSIITGGLWIVVWVLCSISVSHENSRIDRKIAAGRG